MTSQKANNLPNQTETLIIGAGITGLFAAALKLKQGRRVLLTEALEQIGGRNSPEIRDGFQLGAGFTFAETTLWGKLAEKIDLPLDMIRNENTSALVHSVRGWTAPEELPPWEEYLSKPYAQFPRGGIAELTQKLKKYCDSFENFSLHLATPVTAIKAENGKVTSVVLGAEKEVQVQECIWTGGFRTLMDLLQGPGVPEPGPERVSWMRKFNKTHSHPGVVIEFAHNAKIADFTETLLLPFQSGEKEARHYLVGAFIGNRDASLMPQGKQISSWILPLSEGEWGENHEIMKKIRAGKRALEKAFAGFEGSVLFDRVLVLENTIAPLGKRKGEWQPVYENLLPFSDWASPTGAHLDGVLTLLADHC